MTIREIIESPQPQGVDEEIVYTLTTTPWGSDPSASAVVVFDVTDGAREDVTTTVMPAGSPSESGDVVTLPTLEALTASKKYRVEIQFTSGGNVFEAFGIILAET